MMEELMYSHTFSADSSIRPPLIRLHQAYDVISGLMVLLAVVAAENSAKMPDGLTQFLALRVTVKNGLLLFFLLSGWVALLKLFRVYRNEQYAQVRRGIALHLGACAFAVPLALAFPLFSRSGAISYSSIAWYWLGLSIMGVWGRLAASYLINRLPTINAWPRNILVLGSGPRAARLSSEIEVGGDPSNRVIGFMDREMYQPAVEPVRSRYLDGLDDLENFLMQQVVDEVLIALPIRSRYDDIQKSIEICERVGVKVHYLSDVFHASLGKPEPAIEGNLPLVSHKMAHDDPGARLGKRILDVTGALVGITLFSPLMLIAAIGIKLSSKGPVLFRQERYGVNKRIFRMYKFRTMVTNAEALQSTLESMNEAGGPVFKMRQDPRVTSFGRLLRKTSIDELPQFFNVLAGDMSLVGPRPLPRRDVSRFSQPWLMRRFSVKPGLTCLWQISGRSNTSFEHWIAQDLEYIDKWSFALDFKILARTLPAVMRGSGAM
jgi:exopolysaccharide biosynthesis polyprenyl glycosylphosphotransferase